MKKTSFLKFLWGGVISLSLLLSTSCEKDLYENVLIEKQKSNYKIKTVDFEKVYSDELFQNSFRKIPKKKTISSSIYSRSAFEENNGFTIIDAPVKIVERNGITTYTLLIERDETIDGKLENLVLYSEPVDGEIGYIIKYNTLKDAGLTEEQIKESGIDELEGVLTDVNETGRVLYVVYWVSHCIVGINDGGYCGGDPNSPHFLVGQCGHWEDGIIYIDEGGGGSPDYSGGSGSNTGGDGFSYGGDDEIITSPVGMSPKQILNKKFQKHINSIGNNSLSTCYSNLKDDENEALINFLTEELNEDGVLENNFNQAIQLILESCSSGKNLVALIIESEIKSNLDPCGQSVLERLENLNNFDISKILDRFHNQIIPFNNHPFNNYNLTFNSENPVDPNVLGSTSWQLNNQGNPIHFNYKIKIHTLVTQASTDLAIAELILHELVHAYFLSYIDDCYINGNCNQLINNFPDLWNHFIQNGSNGSITDIMSQHTEMSNIYVNIIASALQEFNTGLQLSNGQVPSQVYLDMAWYGLVGTIPFNNLPQVDKDRIISRFENVELLNQSSTNSSNIVINPVGTRTNPCN